MPRYKITIEYDGTAFKGWQRQEDFPSVQQSLEEAIEKLSQEIVVCHGAGRTDTGVHATGQVAHFDLKKSFSTYSLINAINFYLLPNPVVLVEASITDENFHARFSAKRRTYRYVIVNRKSPLVIERERAWHVKSDLDINKMQEAANYLLGHNDFTSFRAIACQSKSPLKTLDKIDIEKTGDHIHITVSAQSFLHHMVRNIVGTLRMVGAGDWEPQRVKEILAAKDRRVAGPTAPAWGLYLEKIDY